MPKPKTITLDAKSISIYDKLVEELKANPQLSNFDIDSISIVIKSKIPPKIRKIDDVIYNAQRYIALRQKSELQFEREELTTKTELSEMLGVSRDTVDEWIKKEFLFTVESKYFKSTRVYSVNVILDHLKKLQSQYKENQ